MADSFIPDSFQQEDSFIPDERKRPSILSSILDFPTSPFGGPTIRELPRTTVDILDTALFGLIPNRLKERLPHVETTAGKVGTGIGQLAALSVGGPGRTAAGTVRGISRIAPVLATSRTGKFVLRALQGGILGGTSDITEPESLPARITAGAILGLFGPSTIESGRRAIRFAKELPKQLELGRPGTIQKPNVIRTTRIEQIRSRLLRAPKLAGREFEQGLNEAIRLNPTQVIDVTQEVGLARTFAQQNPAFNTLFEQAINRAPISEPLRGVIRNLIHIPQDIAQLSIEKSQALKQVFQTALKQKFQQISPEFFGAHLDMLDLWHTLRAKQLAAFPSLRPVFQAYNQALSNFRLLKPALREGNFESAIIRDFSNRGALIRAFRELATSDTLNLVTKFQKAIGLSNLLKRFGIAAGVVAAGAVGAGAVGKVVFRQQ